VTAGVFVVMRLRDPELGNAAVGWASVIVSLLVLGGLQLLTLGVLGEYVGRMHLNLNNRPQYIVRRSKQGS
jgi:undecaprenyl-phosphate 4-deoxy-4-formamido-L-arabinose transferase